MYRQLGKRSGPKTDFLTSHPVADFFTSHPLFTSGLLRGQKKPSPRQDFDKKDTISSLFVRSTPIQPTKKRLEMRSPNVMTQFGKINRTRIDLGTILPKLSLANSPSEELPINIMLELRNVPDEVRFPPKRISDDDVETGGKEEYDLSGPDNGADVNLAKMMIGDIEDLMI